MKYHPKPMFFWKYGQSCYRKCFLHQYHNPGTFSPGGRTAKFCKKNTKKYEFLAILSFWNISNTQKPPFGIKLNALPIKRSDLRHPRTTYVVTPGGQTCTFWRKMTRFWQFSRVFQLLYTFTHEIPPKTYVFLKIWSKLL